MNLEVVVGFGVWSVCPKILRGLLTRKQIGLAEVCVLWGFRKESQRNDKETLSLSLASIKYFSLSVSLSW